MHELKLENLGSQCFEDNKITSLADYVQKVEELYSILEKENNANEKNNSEEDNVCGQNNSEGNQAKELRNDGKGELYFRGQDNIEYGNTCPSLFRNTKQYNHESNMINDFLAKYPDLFKNCQNNVDRLALMQHHQLPTRLLDLTTNALIALYFAVEKDNCKDGVVYVFNNFYNEKFVDKALAASFTFELDKLAIIPHSSSKDHKVLKLKSAKRDSFSDQIEIETSLARMKQTDSEDFITEVTKFYQQLSKHSKSDKEVWGKAYLDYLKALNKGIDYSSLSCDAGKLLHKYDNFNNAVPTIRLYHAIERNSGNFDHIINPVEMYLPKIVTPRIIDQRIKNQQGLFMLVPFIFDNKGIGTESLLTKTQRLINTLLYTRRDVHTGKDKAIAFTIPCCMKEQIRKELSNIGISKSFIYTDATSYAQDIANSYKN